MLTQPQLSYTHNNQPIFEQPWRQKYHKDTKKHHPNPFPLKSGHRNLSNNSKWHCIIELKCETVIEMEDDTIQSAQKELTPNTGTPTAIVEMTLISTGSDSSATAHRGAWKART